MKIAFITTGLPTENHGAAISTGLIVEQLQSVGIDVDIYSISGKEQKTQKINERMYEIPEGLGTHFPKRVEQNIMAWEYMPDLSKYDLVHIYNSSPSPAINLRNWFFNVDVPTIVTYNNLNWVCTNWTKYLQDGCPPYGLFKTIAYSYKEGIGIPLLPIKLGLETTAKYLAKRADLVTVQTSGMKSVLENCGYTSANLDVVPNLLDNRFDIVPDTDNKIMYAGRLSEKKGVLDILNAFIEIETELVANWEFEIYGSGDLEQKIREQYTSHPHISLNYSPYNKLPEIYRNAAVLVHGSKYPEPFSRTWLEAMASETAIVASQNPSSQAVLSDFAELYNPFDPDDLKSTLRSVLEDKDKRIEMQREGKKAVEQYRPDTVIETYRSLYERVLSE